MTDSYSILIIEDEKNILEFYGKNVKIQWLQNHHL